MSTVNPTSSKPPPSPIRMAEVLAAFSLASDLGTGKSMGHALRACYLGLEMAHELRLSTLALADDFQERLQASPSRRNLDPQDVLKAMEPDAGSLFSPDCFAALAEEIGAAVPKPRQRHEWPAGLTNRKAVCL